MKVSPERPSLSEHFARLIQSSGPISVAQYMAEANAHYYGTRDPLGAGGDFTTAPEISQMFGELVGLWLADLWHRAGTPADAIYLELGPGRGTLAADALRAMASAGLWPDVHFVETSPVLRDAQRQRVPNATWHDEIGSLPLDRPLLLVANEFFDALPVHQLVSTEKGWRELLVDLVDGKFVRVPGGLAPRPEVSVPEGTIVETSPASIAIAEDLARRTKANGGTALIIDYGSVKLTTGASLQSVKGHRYADPWSNPGEKDLTAHVDFGALQGVGTSHGLRVQLAEQGRWLEAMGIAVRAASLSKSAPHRQEEIEGARKRLTAPDQMGSLFKVMAFSSPEWPEPAGFG